MQFKIEKNRLIKEVAKIVQPQDHDARDKQDERDFITKLNECSAILAGGAITAIFSRARINDFDFFFRGKDDLECLQKFLIDNYDAYVAFESASAVSMVVKSSRRSVQLIKCLTGNPLDILLEFDFSVCQGAYDFQTEEFMIEENFFVDLASRELKYLGGRYPIASMLRVKKYLKKGYNISGVEMIRIAMAINDVVIKTAAQLKDQLMGIDVVILKAFLAELEKEGEKEYNHSEMMRMMDEHLEIILDKNPLGEPNDWEGI